MTELRDEGLVTDDPVVAAMFFGGEGILYRSINTTGWHEIERWATLFEHMVRWPQDEHKLLIPYPVVWAAIQPVEGEGCIEDGPGWAGYLVVVTYDKLCIESESDVACYHKRVLNIVTTRSELRDLVRRCKEAL